MSQQQAETQAVTTESGIVNVGESLTSFDQLEAIDASAEAQTRAEAQKEVAKEEIKEEITEKKEAKDVVREEEAEAEVEAEAQTEEEVAEIEEPEMDSKVFKALVGEEEKEFDGNAVFRVKVDGEEMDMTLEEIIDGTSGQQAIQKRFGEFGTQKKEFMKERSKFEQERQYLEHKLRTTVDLLGKSPLSGVANIAELAGIKEVDKFMNTFLTELVKSGEALAGMTEEERRLHEQQILTQTKAARLEAREAELKESATRQDVETRAKQIMLRNGIEEETFRETFNELVELQKQGVIRSEITPEYVARVVVQDRHEDKIKSVVQTVRPSLMKDREALKDLVETLIQQDPQQEMDDDDIKDIILQAFPNSGGTEESLSRKVKKSGKAVGKDAPKETINAGQAPISFDELDF